MPDPGGWQDFVTEKRKEATGVSSRECGGRQKQTQARWEWEQLMA